MYGQSEEIHTKMGKKSVEIDVPSHAGPDKISPEYRSTGISHLAVQSDFQYPLSQIVG
jgi:hypothetical protein